MIRIAWSQALASLRMRRGRQALTALGVALGIAFYASMRVIMSVEGDSDRSRWLLATSLLMCFVGVVNSMLLSVAERYREIGTLKCLGASDGLIVAIFLIESILMGLVASSIGAGVGTNGTQLILTWTGEKPSVGSGGWEAVGIGIAMTVVATLAPAVQAARLPATAALRVEV